MNILKWRCPENCGCVVVVVGGGCGVVVVGGCNVIFVGGGVVVVMRPCIKEQKSLKVLNC